MKDNKLTDVYAETIAREDPAADLLARLDKLERDNQESRRLNEKRVVLAELKVEALRANMIDLDGLQFLDMSQVRLSEDGGIADGAELIARLKRAKPWLFTTPSSSSIAKVPPSGPTRQKLAKDMSDAEYRIARANIVKRSGL
jgi:hypothetical protein